MKNTMMMKWVLMAVAVFVVGCQYDYPLVDKSVKPIDKSLLGVWESVPDEGETNSVINRALVLRFSDNEYLIQYPVKEKDSLFFRAYLIDIGGLSCLQVQVLGTDKGPVEAADDTFDVVSYKPEGAWLDVGVLNPQVVDKNATSTAALVNLFMKGRASPALFTPHAKFRKVNP